MSISCSTPQGSRFRRRGVFGIFPLDGVVNPTIRDGDRLGILTRAVIIRDGLVIYEPRRWVGRLGAFDDWLAEHPEWPRLATELPVEPGEQ